MSEVDYIAAAIKHSCPGTNNSLREDMLAELRELRQKAAMWDLHAAKCISVPTVEAVELYEAKRTLDALEAALRAPDANLWWDGDKDDGIGAWVISDDEFVRISWGPTIAAVIADFQAKQEVEISFHDLNMDKQEASND